jgi:tripartite-type tricarboxylate transporter receptor subunit TctC
MPNLGPVVPVAALAALALIAAPLPVPAQPAPESWPSRPVTMVVTFAAGTAGDVLGRILSPRIGELLGRQVIIENVPGGGGVTGANRVAKAAPDGYVFLLGTSGTQAITQSLYQSPLYNAVTDFAPVGLSVAQPIILIERKDLPAANLQEFIAYAKANQSRMSYGSGGTGTANHLACALFNSTVGIKTTHVPYRSQSPLQDLIGGRIDYTCNFPAAAVPLVDAKQMIALAVLGKDRSPSMPSLPTAQEQGVANVEAATWNGIFLPKGTPAPIVQKLHDAVVGTLDTPAVQERLKEIGAAVAPPDRRSPEYLQQLVESEIAKWAAVIKAADVKLD